LKVRDNGGGIDPDIVDRLFDISFTTKGSKGTGLGLAVTRKIAEEHKGSVSAANRPKGGSEFAITLPLKR